MARKVDIAHKQPKGLSKTEIKDGVTAKDKGVYIPPEQRSPTDPEMLKRSKAQHIAAQNARKDKAADMEKHSREYDEKKRTGKGTSSPEEALAAQKPGPKLKPKQPKGKKK